MFGYGRAQNVAALVAATLFISFTSLLYREAIPRLFEPEVASYQNLSPAIGVIVISMFIAAIPLINLFRQKSGELPQRRSLPNCSTTNWGCLLRWWAYCSLCRANTSPTPSPQSQ